MPVTVKLSDSGKLCITFPFSWDYVAKIKAIEGKEWNPDGKYWSIPMSIENIQLLEDIFAGEHVLYDAEIRRFLNSSKAMKFACTQQTQEPPVLPETPVVFDSGCMLKKMKLKGYSTKTIKAYIGHMERVTAAKRRDPKDLSDTEIKSYLME